MDQKIRTPLRENLVFLANAQKIILDVSSILNSEIGTSQSFAVSEKIKDFDKEIKIIDDLKGTAVVNHFEENQLFAFFNLKTSLEITCSRCLKKFKTPLLLNWEQTFTRRKQDDSFPILGNQTIDILPSIRQEILLNIPIKPLCSQKCKGVMAKSKTKNKKSKRYNILSFIFNI